MGKTWLVCAAILIVMPFQLIGWPITLYGHALLLLFIAVFCIGSVMGTGRARAPVFHVTPFVIDWRLADRLLAAAALFASAMLLIELSRGNYLDLSDSYLERSDRAQAVLTGSASSASVLFQLGFLTYPAGFAYLIRAISFERKLSLLRIGIFGLLPPALASLVMGGRSPLLYAALVAFIAYRQRKFLFPTTKEEGRQINWLVLVAGVAVGLILLNYFAMVFVVRADSSGGIEAAYNNAALNWGVTFEGPIASALRSVLGEGNTFLIFIFGWYVVQGIVMSNMIFTYYTGDPTWGSYGVDLVTAIVRRLAGDILANRFAELLRLNVYGFLPSAFGSAFIDFRYFALLPVFLWGYLAGVVHRKLKQFEDARWLLWGPMVSLGILFSVINTPFGFSNGFITHSWVFATFLLSGMRRQRFAHQVSAT